MWGDLHSFNLEAQSSRSRMVPWLLIPWGRSGPLASCFQNPHISLSSNMYHVVILYRLL